MAVVSITVYFLCIKSFISLLPVGHLLATEFTCILKVLFTFLVGPSLDPSGVSFVDCIKVYYKAKDVFGWTEKSAADAAASAAARMPATAGAAKSQAAASSGPADDGSGGVDETDEMLSMPVNNKVVTSSDRYVHKCFCIACILSVLCCI